MDEGRISRPLCWWDRHLACYFLIDRQDACATTSPEIRYLIYELEHLVLDGANTVAYSGAFLH